MMAFAAARKVNQCSDSPHGVTKMIFICVAHLPFEKMILKMIEYDVQRHALCPVVFTVLDAFGICFRERFGRVVADKIETEIVGIS